VFAHLDLPHGALDFPVFLPDATLGAVRALDSSDLESVGTPAVVMNIFHLMQHPGSSTVQALGGLHRMAGWHRPIVTDSGGFQAYSLIRQNAKFGKLSNEGILFRPEGSDRKYQLTPEKCVQLQMSYGADVIMALDDCTHINDSAETQRQSVDRTVAWAQRCRREYDRLMAEKEIAEVERPLLFGVVQGGGDPALRRHCAEALLEIGFDGYGYGGWPLDSDGQLVDEMLAYTRQLIPPRYPMHALGVGHPYNVALAASLGYEMFDSALPTRDARRGRLYTFSAGPRYALTQRNWFKFIYLQDEKHIKTDQPLDESCDCLTCRRYSVGYLHHLFKQSEATFMRLATLHNLRFMARLMQLIRQG
jgi:queuine tRNA-ribosyltransferase